MSDPIGQVIAHYRLDSMLGDGGMGTVYKAYDQNLERTVAVKLMHAHFARQPEFRARLTQEAKTAAQLDHPSIVRVLDFGESSLGPYIVMEYISGGNLRAHLQRLQAKGKYLPLNQSLQIAAQIAEALDYAHRRGVVHRDVKPGNIILKPLSRPEEPGEQPFRALLTDFGLVKLLEGDPMTQSGVTLGTPIYMSPEQCSGEELDGRSDLYSLGVVLYELLSNQLPFKFKTLSEAVAAHMRGAMPTPARELRPDLPPILEAILHKVLAKSPDERFATGGELAEALRSAMLSTTDSPTRLLAQPSADPTTVQPSVPLPKGYRLLIQTPGHEPSIAALSRSIISLGRQADNEVVLPAEGVSRRHARIQAVGSTWEVVDLGSANGTFLDGTRLQGNRPAPLPPGSMLQVGPYQLLMQGPPEAPAAHIPISEAPTHAELPLEVTPVVTSASRSLTTPPSEALSLYLARDTVHVEPGKQAELSVEVVNRGQVDDRVSLQVHGLSSDWVRLPNDFLTVAAGQSIRLPIVIRPPRQADTPAGRQRFRVELTSQQHPNLKPAANAFLVLEGFENFEMGLEPRVVRIPAAVQVSLHNTGNAASEFSVVGRDPQGQIRFRGERGRISLIPGQTAVVELLLEPQEQRWFGGADTYPFEVQVTTRNGLHQSVEGSAQVAGLLPTGLVYVLVFLLVFLCVLLGLYAAFGRNGETPTATPVNVFGPAATQTALALGATQTSIAATAVITSSTVAAQTAAAVGDVDRDGLSDAQETNTTGTDPNNPDTDGDGLNDGEEALRYGTNPRNRDSDADLLSDGDEVKTFLTNPTRADTDGDGVPDGVELQLGTDPRSTPIPSATPATPSVTPTPSLTPLVSPTPTATTPPQATATSTATPAPTATTTATPAPTSTPTTTSTPQPTPTATQTPTPSLTPSPTLTPSPSATATATQSPNPSLTCVGTPPTIDGNVQASEWGSTPLFQFNPPDNPSRLVQVFFVRNATHLYLAFFISDSSQDETDSLRLYYDTTNNGGDPDTADRFFQVARDGSLAIRAGIGNNSDGQQWNADYTSNEWNAAVGEPGGGAWTAEIAIHASAEMGALANPFGMMAQVLFTNEGLANWPQTGNALDANTWQDVNNITCPTSQ